MIFIHKPVKIIHTYLKVSSHNLNYLLRSSMYKILIFSSPSYSICLKQIYAKRAYMSLVSEYILTWSIETTLPTTFHIIIFYFCTAKNWYKQKMKVNPSNSPGKFLFLPFLCILYDTFRSISHITFRKSSTMYPFYWIYLKKQSQMI